MNSYMGTYSYAILSILTMLIMTGLFSRHLSNDEFLEFTQTLRYMGFIVTVSSFSLGFSIIKKREVYSLENEIYPVVFGGVLFTSFFLGVAYTIFFKAPIYLTIWIVSMSLFHVYISSVRSESSAEANFISIQLKVILIISVVVIIISLDIESLKYFFIYGFLVFTYIIWNSMKRGYKLFCFCHSLKVISDLYRHAFSRSLDNLARIFFHIIPVLMADFFIGKEASGLIVLTLIITKTFESSVQPVVLHIHANRVKKKENITLNKVIVVLLSSLLLSVAVKVFIYYFGEMLVTAWITSDYLIIVEYMNIIIWAVPCIVLLQFMKSELESKASISPFVYINVISVVFLVVMSVWFSDNINSILKSYVGVYILKVIASFFLYINHVEKNEK